MSKEDRKSTLRTEENISEINDSEDSKTTGKKMSGSIDSETTNKNQSGSIDRETTNKNQNGSIDSKTTNKNQNGSIESEVSGKKQNSSTDNKTSGKSRPSKTVPRRTMYLIGTAVMIVLLLLDQFTKYLAVQNLKNKPPVVLIKGVLELQYVENTGSAFSLFQGQKMLILIMGVIVLAAAVFFLYKLPADRKFCITHILVTVMIAGALGNIIDRIRFGYVIDFISFVLIHFPVFNAADCFVVVSAIWLFGLFMFKYKDKDLEWIGSVMK